MTNPRIDRRGRSIQELAESTGLSRATIARHTSRTRTEWLQQKAAEREEIRAFHDDQGHSWPETAEHFGLAEDTVKRRAYRARKEMMGGSEDALSV
jgi:DNA-directed RNA polymerase specialized sigma24 family protein